MYFEGKRKAKDNHPVVLVKVDAGRRASTHALLMHKNNIFMRIMRWSCATEYAVHLT